MQGQEIDEITRVSCFGVQSSEEGPRQKRISVQLRNQEER